MTMDEELAAGAAGGLTISRGLASLLLWLLDEREYDVAAEVIDKPWQWVELARAHEVSPDLSFDQIGDSSPQQG